MTDKQRWLLRELEDWRNSKMSRIGKYGPPVEPKSPANVIAARRAILRLSKVVRKWDEKKKAPWKKLRHAIDAKHAATKRVILFEKTEVALKAVKALSSYKERTS